MGRDFLDLKDLIISTFEKMNIACHYSECNQIELHVQIKFPNVNDGMICINLLDLQIVPLHLNYSRLENRIFLEFAGLYPIHKKFNF